MLKNAFAAIGAALLLATAAVSAFAADMAPAKPPLGAPTVPILDLKCLPITFETAEIVGEIGHRRLRITILKAALTDGRTPTLIEVMYFMQPDYYRLVLMACPVVKPETGHKAVADDGTRVTFEEPVGVIGTKGIELEGGRLKKFDLKQ